MGSSTNQPLAARMRPTTLEHFVGQPHLVGPGKPLRIAIESGTLHSMILWGPPGTGKTTLAKLLATSAQAEVATISAVLSGVKEIRAILAQAQASPLTPRRPTALFVDEIHRFNKAQQDAFLPFVEDGTLTLIGATTENPSFELNNALLSRARVYVLKRLELEDIIHVIQHAITDSNQGLGRLKLHITPSIISELAQVADGDIRQALNLLELCVSLAEAKQTDQEYYEINEAVLAELLHNSFRRFDKKGEFFYDQISALHKSIRGSAVDAAIYWYCRMIDGGCDPLYIARRMVRFASEDVGNADPRALTLALNALESYERLGSPEGELAIAQAIIYLAAAPKSNACYVAYNEAMADAKKYGSLEVPIHIRNAPTDLMKKLGYGKHYRYAHDEEYGYAAGENYLPSELPKKNYYRPVQRGLEIKIAEKFAQLRKRDEEFSQK